MIEKEIINIENEKCIKTSIIRKNKILYIQSMHDKTTIIKYKCSALT